MCLYKIADSVKYPADDFMVDRKVISIGLLMLIVAGCTSAQPPKASEGFTQLPPELSAVKWTRNPHDVLDNPTKGEPLVWVGLVKEVLVYQQGTKIEIDWLCVHLRFADPGPEAISKRPIKVRQGRGLFGVSLVTENMSLEDARKFQAEHTRTPHYLLAGGTFEAVQDWKDSKVPFLTTLRMGLGPKLAELVE
jgi:hypothetical protein